MKAFISSTSIDLKEHRRAAAEAIERLGQEVGKMEVFGARPDEPTVACLRVVESCDLYVGIFAHRYGHIPSDTSISITEQEFDRAILCNKAVFCFLVDEDYAWTPKFIDEEPNRSKLIRFKQKVNTRVVRDFFTTPEDLAFKIAAAVGHYLAKGRIEELTSRLRGSMSAVDLSPQSLAQGRALSNVTDDTRQQVRRLLNDLSHSIEMLTAQQLPKDKEIEPSTILTLAQGLMAEHKWLEAGKEYERYAKVRPDDWEANYVRGVAFANCRLGSDTNVAALRAYNDAIVFAPPDIDPNMRGRLFSYRGAILKRRGQLDEAEADLLLAKRYATRQDEIDDINYNFAGVYAQRGERERLLEAVLSLSESPRYLGAIRGHLDDYFELFRNDQEFRVLIGAPRL
jgi:tetratricopeptide (TPR) repeat protein